MRDWSTVGKRYCSSNPQISFNPSSCGCHKAVAMLPSSLPASPPPNLIQTPPGIPLLPPILYQSAHDTPSTPQHWLTSSLPHATIQLLRKNQPHASIPCFPARLPLQTNAAPTLPNGYRFRNDEQERDATLCPPSSGARSRSRRKLMLARASASRP
jgi:hypothetical protein